jgi:hypothetical protein
MGLVKVNDGWKMILNNRHSLGRRGMVAATLAITAFCLRATAKEEPPLEELKARVSSVAIGDRPKLCLEVAELQLDNANKLFAAAEGEKAEAALADAVAFSEQARDYSLQSRKHQKQTEITVRRMTRKLADLKHAVTHDEQPAVQNAIDRLERVRDDLLAAMFHKKG